MCGIIGIYGTRDFAPACCGRLLLNGIKRLEYRGYDSVGIATKLGTSIDLRRDAGRIDEVNSRLRFDTMDGSLGIAHTRWATTGSVTKENSHPHRSQDSTIYVVHNGIIENHLALRKELESNNYVFASQTDTEVIPQLVSFHLSKGYEMMEAFRNTLSQLEGSFAILMISKNEDVLYFARRDSPLVVGIMNAPSDYKYIACSDVLAFGGETDKALYLDNEVYGTISEGGIKVLDYKTNVPKMGHHTFLRAEEALASKGAFPHYMLKEIYEQKRSIPRALEQDRERVRIAYKLLSQSKDIIMVACGSSYHASLSASYLFSRIAHVHARCIIASEFRNYAESLCRNSVLLAISQSGETADIIDAVTVAKEKGASVISIVNVTGSSLVRMSDVSLPMNSGPEICVLSTKTYTSELTILTYLAYLLANRENDVEEIAKKAALEVERILSEQDKNIANIAARIRNASCLFLIGRDIAYPTALEGALKIKEVSYLHAEGFAGGELKHGTIALIDNGTPCISISTKSTRSAILSNASEVKCRGGLIIGIDAENSEVYDEWIEIKDCEEGLPICTAVPLQMLAYHLALERNTDPDMPRNLAKSVTVK